MTAPIRAVVALQAGIARHDIEPLLAGDDIRVVGYVEDLVRAEPSVRDPACDLVIVACESTSTEAVALIERAVEARPDRPLVVLQVGPARSNGFMQDVFAAGADDIITLPETPERVRHALHKALARKRGAALARGAVPAPLVCILGPKGGTGKTVTACNLAVALAETGRRVTLVDLDLRFGDVGLGLRLVPERTIYDLARAGGSLDAEKLDGYLLPHPSGVRALLAPTRPDQAGAISPGFLAELLACLRAGSEMVIVDTPAGFPPEVITAIDGSTDVCVVGMLDAFSLKDTKLGLETLDLMGYDREAVRIVLNRADSHVGIGDDDVTAILGRRPDVLVPSERDIPRSVTEGIPIVSSQPRSPAARAFRALAQLYGAEAGPWAREEKPRRRPSLLRRR